MGQAQSDATAQFITNLVTKPDQTIANVFTDPGSLLSPSGARTREFVELQTAPKPPPPAPGLGPPPPVGNVQDKPSTLGGPTPVGNTMGGTEGRQVTKRQVDKAINENNRTQLKQWYDDPNVDFRPPSEKARIFQFLNPNAPRDRVIPTEKPKGMPEEPPPSKKV